MTGLEEILEESPLSRTEVARRAGIDLASLYRLTRTSSFPTIRTMRRLAYALNVPFEEIVDAFRDQVIQAQKGGK